MVPSGFTVLFSGGWLLAAGFVAAGPYSAALDDPANPHDAPVPGFIGRHGIGKARLQSGVDENGNPVFQNPDNYVNPLFFAWAGSVVDYSRADGDLSFSDPSRALGEVTGDNFDVVSLGDLTAGRIAAGNAAGSITLELARPVRNLSGADFVVFENGLVARSNTGGAGSGGILAELAYVEVSSNGLDFVRFPATSLTPSAVGGYGSISATNVLNLAGKHVNSYATSWGTPFDLAQVGLQEVTHIRLVDIPGDGSFKDRAGSSIYDAWLTFGRVRTVHLNAVIYGWSTNGSLGIIIWLLPRLLRTRLHGALWTMLGGTLINVGVAAGIGAVAIGWTDGMEYLEIPWQIGIFIAVGFVMVIVTVLFTLVNRKVEHLYVSVWYFVAALLWIALLYVVGKLPGVHYGVQQATTNWWFGHNALGLWFTPVAVGAIYYFLPKIIGRPIKSYNLSLLGFWTLAFFYGQVGGHHL